MSHRLSHTQLVQLAEQFGTPLYVYHAEKIKEQYEALNNAFKACNARFFYACKALTNINILKYIESLGAGLDCVSINEVRLGLKAGFTPERILLPLIAWTLGRLKKERTKVWSSTSITFPYWNNSATSSAVPIPYVSALTRILWVAAITK
jgi:hypothetical protein